MNAQKQSTAKTAVFGAEFTAMIQGMDALRGLQCKPRMMGISVLGFSYIYGKNASVIYNKSRPESILKKKTVIITIMWA